MASNPNIVPPSLTDWAKDHITVIAEAAYGTDLTNALDELLSKNATITVNGSELSYAEFGQHLQTEKFDQRGATVSFKDSVEAPVDKDHPIKAGSVGLSYTVLRVTEAFNIHGAPATRQVAVSMNVVIEEDPTIPIPILGLYDPRRVTALSEVFSQVTV